MSHPHNDLTEALTAGLSDSPAHELLRRAAASAVKTLTASEATTLLGYGLRLRDDDREFDSNLTSGVLDVPRRVLRGTHTQDEIAAALLHEFDHFLSERPLAEQRDAAFAAGDHVTGSVLAQRFRASNTPANERARDAFAKSRGYGKHLADAHMKDVEMLREKAKDLEDRAHRLRQP